MLKATTRKTKWGYRGYVECWDIDTLGVTRHPRKAFKIWTETAGIHRPNKEDALEDAERLRKDREPLYT